MFNEYYFVTNWRVKATKKEVFDILIDAKVLPKWWPSVYLSIDMLEEPKEDGSGAKFSLLTKGWLPYTLKWSFESVEIIANEKIVLTAEGDFLGKGIWTFEQDGEYVNINYDWRIKAQKPLLSYLSFLMKPIFSANHRWAMEQGLKSLELELLRRRLNTEEEKKAIAEPPPPTKINNKKVALISLITIGLGIFIYKYSCKKKCCKKDE